MTDYVYPTRRLDRPAFLNAADAAPPAGDGGQWVIAFRVARQLQTHWCWAAVSSSVAAHFGTAGWSQCRVASAEIGRDCCVQGQSLPCNQDYFLEAALRRVGHLRVPAVGYMNPQQVAEELELNRPVCLRVAWHNGGAHFLAIYGLVPQGNEVIFLLTDPIYGESEIQGSLLVNGGYQGAARGHWSHSYVVQP